MNFLALDTSSVACTVAVQVGTDVVERHQEKVREHTHLLMPMIKEVLQAAGIGTSDLDAVVLGNGPGSFIGLRIAAAVAQGLAHGSGCDIIPVSSLAAVAANVFATRDAGEVVIAQDAHMSEVYLGVFKRSASGLPEALGPERLHGQAAITELAEDGVSERLAAGFGWQRYPQLWSLNQSRINADCNIHYPRAEYLLALANSAAAVSPGCIAPAYLREKVAQKPNEACKRKNVHR